MIVMRGFVGDLIFYFTNDHKPIGLDLYRDYLKRSEPELKKGEEVMVDDGPPPAPWYMG